MKTYARVQDGRVAELLKTDGDITAMFTPVLVWIDVSDQAEVAEGWRYDSNAFTPPPAPPPAPPPPTLAELQAQLATLTAQIAALVGKN